MGSFPDHWPLARQVRRVLPISSKPELQLYVATESSVVPPVKSTFPFSGEERVPQSMAALMKEHYYLLTTF